ncbi:AraC family transcriptional regulator [Paenibacillus darwinianus]|uniref:AraC family transcriptional regulator n=1 Tax=Paenibacillus darwinianus TaxID=1380763 RepID=A0A9W5RYP1_9BACL|nr:response regulator [Paenibacillus darwinianus]EXX85211.1 AraC family transcriptional regulator [Paenibacillus darwinianus]EXX85265.1 AraC family transcriptional regulator [Paenibacillus darwinianus]EXX85460.1 AraC family transcriptional regulator [Paenibacillus darwinianus]
MCRVLLVDDEKMARVGLRSSFDWVRNGFQLVGEASNGQKAMKWIQNQEVDILITDIAMPVMDGLELTRKTRELCPWVKVLLLSCHNNFEYVREGIRLGACDYILKPTLDSDSLKTVLDEMRNKLRKEQEHRKMMEQLKERQQAEKLRAIERTFGKAVCGEHDAFERLKLVLPEAKYRVAAFGLHAVQMTDNDTENMLAEYAEASKQYIEQSFEPLVSAQLRPDLLMAMARADLFRDGALERMVSRIAQASERFSVSVGVSGEYDRFVSIRDAGKEAKRALERTFFSGPASVVLAEALHDDHRAVPSSFDYPALLKQLKESLSIGFQAKSEAVVERIIAHWTPGHRTKEEVIQEAEELLSLLALFKDTDASIMRNIRQISKLNYAGDVAEFVRSIFTGWWIKDDAPQPDRTLHQRIVGQAVGYIEEHYTEPLSLLQVADAVNVSRNYFSEMFKWVTGQNFIDYLIALRMKRAKELLQGSSLKVYEVAEQSGFNDVKHFSKQFKKLVGLSPAEFQGVRRK